MTTTEFIATARKRFQRCVDATSMNRPFQLDDIRFAAGSPDNGWQWPDQIRNSRLNDPNGARPVLTINKLTQHIRLVVNEQRKNKPAGKILPVDDKGDPEVAEILQGILRHIEVASHADIAYDTASESQVTIGEGYWRILTDYCDETSFDQDIRIAAIKNAFSVYLDPDGLKKDSTGRECQYGFITVRMPKDEFKLEFPDAKDESSWDDIGIGDDTYTWFDDTGVMVAEYFYIETKDRTLLALSDGTTAFEDELPAGWAKLEGAPTVINKRTVQVKQVKWAKINGCEVLEGNEAKDAGRDWIGKYIPIVRIVGNEWDVEGQVVTSGIVRNAKDPQRMINYWTSQEAEILALAPKAPFIAAVGQLENQETNWRDANVKNFAYLEYNPVEDPSGRALPPPQRQQPPMPPVGFLQAKAGSNDDLQSAVGQYNPSLGADAQEKSGKAIMARQQQADIGTYHYVDNLVRGIAFSTEQILDLIPRVYDTQRVARIIGEDGEPDHVNLAPGSGQAVTETENEMGEIQKIYDPTVGRYDVVVTVGQSFATKRLEAAEFLTQSAMAAKDPITSNVISYLAMKNQDWTGAEEAASLMKKLIPPEILADDENDQNDVDAKMAKVQQAAAMLGQKEAQINAAHEQVAQAAEQATQQEEAAKAQKAQAESAIARAQTKVSEINAQQAELNAAKAELVALKREMEAAKRVAQLESENHQIAQQAKIKETVFTVERMLAKHEQAVRGEIEANKAGEGESTDAVQSILESTAATADMVRKMLATLAADRELITDENGEPIGSRVVMSGS